MKVSEMRTRISASLHSFRANRLNLLSFIFGQWYNEGVENGKSNIHFNYSCIDLNRENFIKKYM